MIVVEPLSIGVTHMSHVNRFTQHSRQFVFMLMHCEATIATNKLKVNAKLMELLAAGIASGDVD